FTDPTFALLSTSLTKDPANPTPAEAARYKLMVALMRNLVSDARADGYTLSTTTLDVKFDKEWATFTEDAGGNWYYGPVTVNAQSSNGTGTTERIYLTASGMYASDFVFMDGASLVAVALHQEPMYGSTTKAPYVDSGESFYIKVPASVANDALVNIGQKNDMNFAYLALHGLARSQDVTYSGTPAIMAWQGTPADSPQGEQDWGHVQAFIGFVNNIEASLYGEGHLFMRGNSDGGVIRVSKAVLGATDASNAGSFALKLEVFDNVLDDWVPVPLIPGDGGNITGGSGLNGPSPGGLFSLVNGSTVEIINLPLGRYRVSEQTSFDGYSAAYAINSGSLQTGFAAEVTLGMQSTTGTIAFTNTIVPHDITYTGKLTVSKTVRGVIEGVARFAFVLERYNSELERWEPVALDPGSGGNITGNAGLSAPNAGGAFSLAAKDTVEITGLSPGRYRVTEAKGSGGYTAVYQVDSGEEQQGFAAEAPLTADKTSCAVVFINTAEDSGGSVVPATGDVGGRQIALLAGILVAGGIVLLVRRKVLRTQI
ncbi:MAG: hypothetical protein LBC23_04345, partial [Coriobacteriales bacterium]|nr:hypothetical protein [Coriobacteriales bacterium]